MTSVLPAPANQSHSATLLRVLLNQLPAVVWTTDRDLRFTSVQGAALPQAGTSGAPLVGATLVEFFATEDANFPAVAAHRRALAGQTADFEMEQWGRGWACHVEPLYDEQGQIVGTVGMARDTTERTQADNALREKEAQYRSIFEATTEGLLIRNLDGIVVEVNPAHCRMNGYTREEMIGQPITQIIDPNYRHIAVETSQAIQAGQPYRVEAMSLRKDGTSYPVEARGTPFTYKGQPHVLAVVRDITERKQAEEALRESQRRLEDLVNSLDGIVWEADAATVQFTYISQQAERLLGYPTARWLTEPTFWQDHMHPDDQGWALPYCAAATREMRAHELEYRMLAADGRVVWLHDVVTVVVENGRPVKLRGVMVDITEKRQAAEALQQRDEKLRQQLEQRVAERTHELSTLLDISQTVASTLELKPLLSLILDQLQFVADYSGASILTLQGDELIYLDHRRPEGLGHAALPTFRYQTQDFGEIWRQLSAGKAVIIDDISANSPLAADYRRVVGPNIKVSMAYMRAWLGVPLLVKDQIVGALTLSHVEPHHYTPHHAELTMAIANHAALAIENARLYESAQEAARKTAALARIASSVALGGSLETALNAVAQNVVEASGAVACSLMVKHGQQGQMSLIGTHGLPEGYALAANTMLRRGTQLLSARRYEEVGLWVTRHVREYVMSRPEYAPLHPFQPDMNWDTMVSLPASYQGRQQARLNLYYPADHEPNAAELDFLTAISNQAAIAIENARLFAEVEGKAALEERQRLARELHDSVSQALYGIVLGAETARAYLTTHPDRLAHPLEYIRSLADAGLAEMRALIFELRPESLETEGIVAALTKHSAALRARYEIEVETNFCDEPSIPLDVKEALYRIAQEAMHNVVKHAEASAVAVRLACDAEQVTVEIRDNGLGFETDGEFPGHLGLKSMRERAWRLGGDLSITSAPGQGTAVRAIIPFGAEHE